jgi:hypothetical protein
MTCNNAHVPEGLLTFLYVGIGVVAAFGGEAFVVAWLLVRRRVSLGWLSALVAALAVGVVCVWLITDIAALRAGLEAGIASGKGVCMVFWNQQQYLAVCAAIAVVLAATIGARVWLLLAASGRATRA